MADDASSPSLPKLAEDIAVLSIKVVGDVAGDFGSYAQKILERPNVQEALRKELDKLARQLFETAAGVRPAPKPEDAAKAFVQKAGEILEPAALEELKKASTVQELTRKVNQFADAIKKAPIGVWFDRNSSTIYIVTVGAALAGVVTMYALQTGDVVTNTLLPLLDNKQVKWKEFTFGVASLRFTPSDRAVELKGFVTRTWQKVQDKVSLAGKAVGPHVESASGTAQVVTGGWTFSATAGTKQGGGNLALGVTYEKDKLKIDVLAEATKAAATASAAGPQAGAVTPAIPGWGLSGKAGVTYQGKGRGLPVDVGVQGNVGQGPGGGVQWGVLGTISVTLDPVKK